MDLDYSCDNMGDGVRCKQRLERWMEKRVGEKGRLGEKYSNWKV